MLPHIGKTILWPGVVVCAVVLGLANLDSVSAKNNKVNICHYQKGNDSWKLISVGQPAAGAHLENHDDALPGGTTSQTGTALDADCKEVEVICPCEGQIAGGVVWSDVFNVSSCDFEGLTLFVDQQEPIASSLTINLEAGQCNIFVPVPDPGLAIPGLTNGEVAACEASIRRIAANDGVNCPE